MTINVSNLVISSIGESSATLRVAGDGDSDVEDAVVYAAVRTSGPYSTGSTGRSEIKNGTGAAWYDFNGNAGRVSFQSYGLAPSTRQYVGVYADDGTAGAVLNGQFDTIDELDDPSGGRPLPNFLG